ncbi:MAG: FtsQ-type POTRA domain-containing protein [Gammaproteobacteria bacterium]|nr:FtsQ-type POTRA domain-containing protein [Gammaproteobacteria bacterium]
MDIRRGKFPFPSWNHSFKFVLLGAIVLSLFFLINQLKLSQIFPIKKVQIFGSEHLDHDEMKFLVSPLVEKSFFTVNVDQIRERLRQLPWASDIFVRRQWPDKIEVRVVEKKAIAHWNGGTLLSHGGVIFSPKKETYPNNLPQFRGPDGKQMIMLKYYDEINRLLSPLHAKISYLELTPYYHWKVMLSNGITLQIGHKDILTRLDHFVKVYPKIVGTRAESVEYVDLRYANGMAIRWKDSYRA